MVSKLDIIKMWEIFLISLPLKKEHNRYQNLYDFKQSIVQKSLLNLRNDYSVYGDYLPHFTHFHIFTFTTKIFFSYQVNNLIIFLLVLLIHYSNLSPRHCLITLPETLNPNPSPANIQKSVLYFKPDPTMVCNGN